jgi:hypothetical protein
MLFLVKWCTGQVEVCAADSAEALAERYRAQGYEAECECGGVTVTIPGCRSSFAVPLVFDESVEMCSTKADLGYNPHNADWCMVRGDDPAFPELAAMDRYAGQVRGVRHPEHYGVCTRYDFDGPC